MADDALITRLENPTDADAVRRVETAAFGRPDEAAIVDAIRGTPDEACSIVGELAGEVLGHAFFTRVTVAEMPSLRACALGPVAVEPGRQSEGIGGTTIRDGIERYKAEGWQAMFVLGDPRYYGRFGFELAAPVGFHYSNHDFDRAFQMQWLSGPPAGDAGGWVVYHSAFG